VILVRNENGPWVADMEKFIEQLERVCGKRWDKEKQVYEPTGEEPPRSLILIDESWLRPFRAELHQGGEISERDRFNLRCQLSGIPDLVRDTAVDVVLAVNSTIAAAALREGRLLHDEVEAFVRSQYGGEVPEQTIRNNPLMRRYPAIGWKDVDEIRMRRVDPQAPHGQFLRGSRADESLYDALRRVPATAPPSPMNELEGMIGLQAAKDQVRNLINHVRANADRQRLGLESSPLNPNTVFCGNPGTGKTHVAKILARAFLELKMIQHQELVEATAADLLGQYVGESRQKTRELCERSIGHVVFIDEAYDLMPRHGNEYGNESIAELLKWMLERNDEVIFILAGYAEPMRELLKSNPGFPRRIGFEITFEDYDDNELLAISHHMAERSHDRIQEGCDRVILKRLGDYREECRQHDEVFQNAGEAERLLQGARLRRSERLYSKPGSRPTADELQLLVPEDFTQSQFGVAFT